MSRVEYLSPKEADFQKPLAIGVIAALTMLCAGYGALAAFWHMGSYPVPPGLYDFYAATWGDGLFLSVGCGALVAYVLQRNANKDSRLSSSDYRLPTVAGFVGFVIGALVQASWLIRDDVKGNWTLPEPHRFNAPGWYHAAYFCLCIAFFFFSSCLAVRSKQRKPTQSSSLERICEAMVGFSATGYLVMHMHDDHGNLLVSETGLLLPLLAIVGVFLTVGLLFWRDDRDYFCAVLSGCISSLGLSAFIAYDQVFQPQLWLLVASVALTGSSLAFVRSIDDEPFCWRAVALTIAVFGSAICTVGHFNSPDEGATLLPLSISVLSWVLLFIAALIQCDKDWWNYHASLGGTAVLATACALGFTSVYFVPHQSEGGIVEFLINTALLGLIALYAKRAIGPIKQAERQRSTNVSDEVGRVQLRTYSILVIVALGTLGLFLFKLFGNSILEIKALFESPYVSSQNEYYLGLAGYGIALLAYCILGKKNCNLTESLQTLCIATSYYFLFSLVKGLRGELVSTQAVLLELFIAGFGSLYVTEVYLSNIALIRCRRVKANEYANALIIYAGCCATIIRATIPSAGIGSEPYSSLISPLVGIIVVVASVLITPAVTAQFSCTREKSDGILIKNTPVLGIVQNGAAAVAMISFLGSFSITFMVRTGSEGLFNTISSLISLVIGGYIVVTFPIINNSAFLRTALDEFSSLRENEKRRAAELELLRLSLHLQRQTLLVFLTLFPWSLVVILTAAIGQDGPVTQYLRNELLIHKPREMLLALSELAPGSPERAERLEVYARRVLAEQRACLPSAKNSVEE